MHDDKNLKSIEILKGRLNKEIREIYVTGFSEVRSDFNFFSTMDWWYYVEFEDCFLCIETSQTIGTIELHIHQNIQCNFEIQEDDIFTVKAINNTDYRGQKIVAYDLFYGVPDSELFAFGIQFEDPRTLDKRDRYVFFDSLTFDGIEVGDRRKRDRYLEDDRFYLEKLG